MNASFGWPRFLSYQLSACLFALLVYKPQFPQKSKFAFHPIIAHSWKISVNYVLRSSASKRITSFVLASVLEMNTSPETAQVKIASHFFEDERSKQAFRHIPFWTLGLAWSSFFWAGRQLCFEWQHENCEWTHLWSKGYLGFISPRLCHAFWVSVFVFFCHSRCQTQSDKQEIMPIAGGTCCFPFWGKAQLETLPDFAIELKESRNFAETWTLKLHSDRCSF